MILKGRTPKLEGMWAKRRPVDLTVVGIDGSGKSSVSSALKSALGNLGLNTKIIDVPHYSDLQGYAFFRWLSRVSKKVISTGARRKNKITFLVGSMMAVLPFRISKLLMRGVDIRILERNPRIEGAIFEVYGKKGLANTMRQFGKAAGGFAPRLIIFMNIAPEIAAKRIAADRTRAGKWDNTEFLHEKRENLTKLQSVYEGTISLLKKTYGNKIAVIEIDGSQSIEKSVQQIVQELKGLKIIAS